MFRIPTESELSILNSRTILNIALSPNAPYLSLALSGPPNLSLSGEYRLEITIHHDINEKANPNNKPITFGQTYLSDFLSGRYILLRHRPQGPEWIREENACTLVNESDEIFVGQDSRFISLAPGECHTTTSRIWPDTEFVENLEVGVKYSYQFVGNEIAWWDWGTKEVSPCSLRQPLHMSFFPSKIRSQFLGLVTLTLL